MKQINAWLTILIAIILALPLLGVTQLGTVTEGILAWILVIVVLIVGILGLTKKK
ncbi:MAG: hypothetical protein PHH54_05295 [Candidatus Nanoarchaeia archaeon]|nr:hypothetical protein [Candidatus Nanoarchaeia archaeon]MDD5741373.1 hypothetical protein [Candidatus Nanoarchaeia archaeon]